MLTEEEIARAKEYVEELRCSADGLNLPNNSRTRAAGPCFAIAQEHHHAIIRLFEWRLFAAAFALIRIEFEAYLRGAWLLLCASDSVVETFLQGKEPPKVDCLIAELEMLDSFRGGELSKIKQKIWKSMCAYTHTGGLHVQRWNTEERLEANYSGDEILEMVKFAETIASLSIHGIASLADNIGLALGTLEASKKRDWKRQF
jgi:hypothetical protein